MFALNKIIWNFMHFKEKFLSLIFHWLSFLQFLQVNAALNFVNFPKKSQVPVWLKEIILSSSEDHLRKFLVFVTGSPSISSTSYKAIEINVRCQARSGSLPIAHTCFFHLGNWQTPFCSLPFSVYLRFFLLVIECVVWCCTYDLTDICVCSQLWYDVRLSCLALL